MMTLNMMNERRIAAAVPALLRRSKSLATAAVSASASAAPLQVSL